MSRVNLNYKYYLSNFLNIFFTGVNSLLGYRHNQRRVSCDLFAQFHSFFDQFINWKDFADQT